MDEQWRSVPEYEGFYDVSDHGRVRSVSRWVACRDGSRFIQGVVLSNHAAPPHYPRATLRKPGTQKRRSSVHSLVLLAFVGPRPPGCVARHLDGDPSNNHLSNLQYGTPRQNAADRRAHGRDKVGEQHPSAQLTEQDVLMIREAASKGASQRSLAKQFGVSQGHISRVVRETVWREVCDGDV